MSQPEPDKKYWLDEQRNVNKLIWALVLVCGLLFLSDFFYYKKSHFDFEQWWGFYGWYGFLAYCGIVLSAKALRRILKRDESYYD